MSALGFVRTLLLENEAVNGACGGRISFVDLPQKSELLAIALILVSSTDDRLLGGQAQYPVARIIVDTIGETYSAADNLGELVRTALLDFMGVVDGFDAQFFSDFLDTFDRGPAGHHWRRRLGFEVRYRKA